MRKTPVFLVALVGCLILAALWAGDLAAQDACIYSRDQIYPYGQFDYCQHDEIDVSVLLGLSKSFTANIPTVAWWEFGDIRDSDSYYEICELLGQNQNCFVRYAPHGDNPTGQFDAALGATYQLTLSYGDVCLPGLDSDCFKEGKLHFWHGVQAAGDLDDDYCAYAVEGFDLGVRHAGAFEYRGDDDWIRLGPVDNFGEMRTTLEVPAGQDYRLEIWNDACTIMIASSDKPVTEDEELIIGVAPGYYRMHATGKGAQAGAPFEFRAELGDFAIGDAPDDACPPDPYFTYPAGHTVSGNLEIPGDNDWHIIDVPAEGKLVLSLDAAADSHYRIELWRDCQTLWRQSVQQAGARQYVAHTVTPGSYYTHIFSTDPSEHGAPYTERSWLALAPAK